MSKTATTMKLSKKTLDIFKNFSAINASIYVEPGNKLYTVSSATSVVAIANIDETFDNKFCIYELSKFLGIVSLFSNPEFEFDDKYVTISGQNGTQVKYHFCQPRLVEKLVGDHGKTPKITNPSYKFTITTKQIDDLIRAASVLQLSSLKITKNDDVIDITAFDKSDASANTYTVNIMNGIVNKDDSEEVVINIDLLKLMPGDYDVEIGSNFVTKWSNKSTDLTYYIVKEKLKD
jgi:hypothetical protein